MKISAVVFAFGTAAVVAAAYLVPSARFEIIRSAQAVVGMPLTPVSYAGVARRTTRRAVYATSAATAAAAAAHPTTVVVSTPPPTTVVAVGTIVHSLPTGCVSKPIGGVTYYACGSVYYRPAYQGNDLVFVVAQP